MSTASDEEFAGVSCQQYFAGPSCPLTWNFSVASGSSGARSGWTFRDILQQLFRSSASVADLVDPSTSYRLEVLKSSWHRSIKPILKAAGNVTSARGDGLHCSLVNNSRLKSLIHEHRHVQMRDIFHCFVLAMLIWRPALSDTVVRRKT